MKCLYKREMNVMTHLHMLLRHWPRCLLLHLRVHLLWCNVQQGRSSWKNVQYPQTTEISGRVGGNKLYDKRMILRFVILYGSFNIARDSLRQALVLHLNPAPGNHSGTYCTFGMDCQWLKVILGVG
jgi:hypothetical protein